MDELKFCTKCGHEIPVGAEFCAYCGTRVSGNTDPVAAGARYEKYAENSPDNDSKAKWEGNAPQAVTAETKYRCMVCGYIHHGATAPNQCPVCRARADKIIPVRSQAFNVTISCYKCGSMIPADSKYCPSCQSLLFVECPNCGYRYSAQYHNCSQCGTNREEYLQQQKEREEEQERQRRRQEEALRQAEKEKEAQRIVNMPKILSFTCTKWSSKSSKSEGVWLKWSTENVDHCDLSWYKGSEDCWYYFIPDHNYIKLQNLEPNSKIAFEGSELIDMCPLFHSDHSIPIRLEAYGKSGDFISETITLHLRSHWFSPLEILE